jgi:very-short-patch-repair endonuclease
LRLAAFQNPDFYRAQAMRLATHGKSRVIACAEDHPLHLGLPRGCLDDALRTLQDLGVRATLRDERCSGRPLATRFLGELRPEQVAAGRALLAHETGVLAATTAFGKTVVAAWFVDVARPLAPDAEGAERARSATEAFLYHRLETLPQTRGRFRLNAVLPIAFDGFGQLEVDLLCDDGAQTRIAVELDGDQHLADPLAYRRDRRKDLLLQENGYLVLRFLAQDVGKDLDRVLDTLLRALARRRGKSEHPPACTAGHTE